MVDKIFIDGTLERGADPRGYRIWRAVEANGSLVTAFYGPNSLLACALFVQMWNEQNIKSHPIEDVWTVARQYALRPECV